MKLYKKMIIWTAVIGIVTLAVAIVITLNSKSVDKSMNLLANILIGIFASSLLLCVNAVIGYKIEKVRILINIYRNVQELNTFIAYEGLKNNNQKVSSKIRSNCENLFIINDYERIDYYSQKISYMLMELRFFKKNENEKKDKLIEYIMNEYYVKFSNYKRYIIEERKKLNITKNEKLYDKFEVIINNAFNEIMETLNDKVVSNQIYIWMNIDKNCLKIHLKYNRYKIEEELTKTRRNEDGKVENGND